MTESIGPKTLELLKLIGAAKESYPAAPGLPTDFEWGLVNRTSLSRMRKAGLVMQYKMGVPVKLTRKGRSIVSKSSVRAVAGA